MEAKRAETESLQENSLLWMTCRAGIPRFLVESLIDFSKYCADRVPEKMGLGFLRVLAALLVIVVPRSITYTLLYPIFRLVFGNLYPAYASYKAVRTKNVKEYVKWMMYWIVFALFTCAETFTDVFFSFWFPFYYEIKTILVVWLLSPATKGSSILYRRFVHPALIRREAEIDDALARATEQGYTAVLHLGSKGVNYATTVLMQTAIKDFLKPVPNEQSELPASQSEPSISSLAKHPPTSNPLTETNEAPEVDFAPVDAMSSGGEEVDDELDKNIVADKQPLNSNKTRKTKKNPGKRKTSRTRSSRTQVKVEYLPEDDVYE